MENEFAAAVKQLENELAVASLKLSVLEGEFQIAVDAEIDRPKKRGEKSNRQAIDNAFDAMQKYRTELIGDIEAAIRCASEYGITMPNCEQLAKSLEGGFDVPAPHGFLFDARVEIERLHRSLDTRVMLDDDDIKVLQAALACGADSHVVKSNSVYRQAFGANAGDMPRNQRSRLKDAGTIQTKRGAGFQLTARGIRVANQ